MFTGLVESLGRIVAVTAAPAGLRILVGADIASEAVLGESVSVNGVCLTVVEAGLQGIHFDVSPETLRVTTLNTLNAGTLVNLERSLRADARVGGHFVQGHVDATGTIEDVRQEGECYRLTVAVPGALMPLIVQKGSIAVDGVSLTVASIDDDRGCFDVQIVPFTWQHTRFSAARQGDAVNVECDILGNTSCARSNVGALGPHTNKGNDMTAEKRGGGSRKSVFASIDEAIEAIRDGKMIIVVDDEDRENEGDLTIAAEKITPEAINFMAKYGRGLICMPMTEDRLEELDLPQMVQQNTARFDTAFCVSIEAKGVTSTGISASDRAVTVLTAIDPATRPADLARPGHMFPLKARTGGVLVRAGQTEAAVDLSRIAGLYPAGVICEIMNDDGTMARVPELAKFAKRHKLLMVTISDLIQYRMRTEAFVRRVAAASLPTEYGQFKVVAFESVIDRETHVAMVKGDIGDGEQVLVRVHSRCLTGDVFHSARCDCGPQLEAALGKIAAEGRGILLYLNQEGRGIGLSNKIRAYELQDQGLDTVEANERLGFKADQRDYGIGVQILKDLGVRSMRLLSNNPRKLVGIEGYKLSVTEWIPLEIPPSEHSRGYLRTKKEKLGHKLSDV